MLAWLVLREKTEGKFPKKATVTSEVMSHESGT